MKPLTLLLLLLVFSISKSQSLSTTFKNTSLDVITDAASIALGESFVANPSGNFAYFENPAALPIRGDAKLFYNIRSNGWMKLVDNFNFTSAGFITGTPLGNVGISYNRSTTGRVPISPLDESVTTEDHNQTIIVSISRNIFRLLSAGIGVKLFNRSLESFGGSNYQISSTNTILFDFGLLFNLNGLIGPANNPDRSNIGFSVQNFGTDYEEEYKYLFNEKVKQILPRYLRAGLAYEINLTLGQKSPTNIDLLLTGEYKNLLNPGSSEKGSVDYWGGGVEATLFKIVSLRLGGFISPENNILFDRAKLNVRYGVGLNLPIAWIGLETPLNIKLDYAIIPVNQTTVYSMDGNPSKSKSSLYAFGLSLSYYR